MNEPHETRRQEAIETFDRYAYRLISVAAVVLIAVATIVYTTLEDWSFVDSLYFSVVAVTTVGFGDLTPSTDLTKLFTVAYLVSGVSLIATYFNLRTRRRRSRQRARHQRRHADDDHDVN